MGTQRCPVGTDRTDLATPTADRRSRSSVARHASGTQRNSVGLGHGGAMARIAQEISAVPDLPSPLPAVGAGRQAGRHLARAGRGVARPRKTATGGGFYRRLLHGGKKGGGAVGPTKRGKGTKIIALAEDPSLPLAVSIESASPHESQLVEGVLGHRFLDTLPARLIGDKAYASPLGSQSGRALWHRVDRPASRRAPRTDSGRPSLAALPQALASGTILCLAPSLSSVGDPLGVPRRELLRHGAPRLYANPVQIFMRPVLEKSRVFASSQGTPALRRVVLSPPSSASETTLLLRPYLSHDSATAAAIVSAWTLCWPWLRPRLPPPPGAVSGCRQWAALTRAPLTVSTRNRSRGAVAVPSSAVPHCSSR